MKQWEKMQPGSKSGLLWKGWGARGGREIGQGMNHALWATSYRLWIRRAGLVMVTRVSPSPVTARLGCGTEAALRPRWVSRIG